MRFNIGDKFMVDNTEGQILYINNDLAWLFPLRMDQEGEFFRGKPLIMGLAFAKLNSKGRLEDGTKAYPIIQSGSGAI